MVFKELKNEDGYTVAELLIALTIVSIVLALASSVFIFVNRQMNTWKVNTDFYNNYQLVQNKLYNDILKSESIISSDTSIMVTDISEKNDKYNWRNGIILLNSKELSITKVDSLMVQVNNDPLAPGIYRWSVRQRKEAKIMDQNFILHLRKPVLWEPIRKTNSGGF